MEHVGRLHLLPVLPPVALHFKVMFLAKQIHRTPGGSTHSIGMEPRVHGDGIIKIKLVDPSIEPVNFVLLVGEVVRLGAVVVKPG